MLIYRLFSFLPFVPKRLYYLKCQEARSLHWHIPINVTFRFTIKSTIQSILKKCFFINIYTVTYFAWAYVATDASKNNMFTSTIMKDFPLNFENSIYVPNFTDWMSDICECMFTSLGVMHYLIFNLRDLKLFRFSKSVSIYFQGCFEELFLILLQRDQKLWKVGRIYRWTVRNLQFSYILEKILQKLVEPKTYVFWDIHRHYI